MIDSEMSTAKVFQLDQPMRGRCTPPFFVSAALAMRANARFATFGKSFSETFAVFTNAVLASGAIRMRYGHLGQSFGRTASSPCVRTPTAARRSVESVISRFLS